MTPSRAGPSVPVVALLLLATLFVLTSGCGSRPSTPSPIDSSQSAKQDKPEAPRVPSRSPAPELATPDARPATRDPEVAPPAQQAASRQSGPWESAFQSAARPFLDTAFIRFPTQQTLTSAADLRQWLTAIDGHPLELKDVRTRLGTAGRFTGLAKWRMPWQANVGLRVSVDDTRAWRWHFFDGLNGVTFSYDESDEHRWLAYAVTRDQTSTPQPQSYALTGHDNGRNLRSGIAHGGPYEFRYLARDRAMAIYRGDVPLLVVPMAQPPQDVYMEGMATFFGTAAVHSRDPVAPQLSPTNNVEGSLPTASTNKTATIFALPSGEARQVILKLKDPPVGLRIGVNSLPQLGDNFLLVAKNRSHDASCIVGVTGSQSDLDNQELGKPPLDFVPAIGRVAWIRLVLGPHAVRWWLSADGRSWAEPSAPLPHHGSDARHLILTSDSEQRKLDIRQLVRQLQIGQLPALAKLRRVTAADGLDAPLKTTGEDSPDPKSVSNAETSIDTAVAACLRHMPQQTPVILDELAMLLDGDPDRSRRHEQRYFDVGSDLMRTRDVAGFDRLRRHLHLAAFPRTRWRHQVVNDSAIRADLLFFMFHRRWDDLLRQLEYLRFFHWHRNVGIYDWVTSTAARAARDAGLPTTAVPVQRAAWRHPWVESLDRDSFNQQAELRALVGGMSWQQAAQFIGDPQRQWSPGLAPDPVDGERFLSWQVNVAEALGRQPIRDAMQQSGGDAALLRINEAMSRGREATVRRLAIRSAPLKAGRSGMTWLGDRAMALGWMDEALGWYWQTYRLDPAQAPPQLIARLRLASALSAGPTQGDTLPPAGSGPVTLGGRQFTRPEFENLIRAALHNNARLPPTSPIGLPHKAAAAREIALLDGPGGSLRQKTGDRDNRRGNPQRKSESANAKPGTKSGIKSGDALNWPGGLVDRQLSLVLRGNLVLYANRHYLVAFHAKTAKQLWRSELNELGATPTVDSWPGIAMTPLIRDEGVFARVLRDGGPQLICLSTDDGSLKWIADLDGAVAVSDPWLIRGQLRLLAFNPVGQAPAPLMMFTLDPASGEIVGRRELLTLRYGWWQRRQCRVAVVGHRQLISLAGMTFCCDTEGEILWLRRHATSPASEENVVPPTDSRGLRVHGLLVDDERVFVWQAGMWQVDCLDVETGALLWKQFTPAVCRLLGVAGDRLLLETEQGLEAFSRADGARGWAWPCRTLQLPAVMDDRYTIVVRTRPDRQAGVTDNSAKDVAEWVWLENDSGRELASRPLLPTSRGSLRGGPTLWIGKQLWYLGSTLGDGTVRRLYRVDVE